MTINPPLAIVRDYNGLVAALRSRAAGLKISREAIDAISGVPSGYSAKLLAPVPIRALGPTSLGPILGAMGLMMLVVEDTEALQRITVQLSKHKARRKDAGSAMLAQRKHKRRGFSAFRASADFARIARAGQIATQPEAKRKSIARKAAQARWKKRREERKQRRVQDTSAGAVS